MIQLQSHKEQIAADLNQITWNIGSTQNPQDTANRLFQEVKFTHQHLSKFEVHSASNNIAVYKNTVTKEIYTCYRATNFSSLADIANVGFIALTGLPLPNRELEAYQQYYKIKNDPQFKDYTIIHTGHSAGGTVAQCVQSIASYVGFNIQFNPGTGYGSSFNQVVNNRNNIVHGNRGDIVWSFAHPNQQVIKHDVVGDAYAHFLNPYFTNAMSFENNRIQHQFRQIFNQKINQGLLDHHSLDQLVNDSLNQISRGLGYQGRLEVENFRNQLNDLRNKNKEEWDKIQQRERKNRLTRKQNEECQYGVADAIHDMKNLMMQYVPKKYQLATEIFSNILRKCIDQNANIDLTGILRQILPKKITKVIESLHTVAGIQHHCINIKTLHDFSQIKSLDMAQQASFMNSAASIVNSIVNLIPGIPQEIKLCSSLIASLSNLQYLLAVGAPQLQIAICVIGILMTLFQLCNCLDCSNSDSQDGNVTGEQSQDKSNNQAAQQYNNSNNSNQQQQNINSNYNQQNSAQNQLQQQNLQQQQQQFQQQQQQQNYSQNQQQQYQQQYQQQHQQQQNQQNQNQQQQQSQVNQQQQQDYEQEEENEQFNQNQPENQQNEEQVNEDNQQQDINQQMYDFNKNQDEEEFDQEIYQEIQQEQQFKDNMNEQEKLEQVEQQFQSQNISSESQMEQEQENEDKFSNQSFNKSFSEENEIYSEKQEELDEESSFTSEENYFEQLNLEDIYAQNLYQFQNYVQSKDVKNQDNLQDFNLEKYQQSNWEKMIKYWLSNLVKQNRAYKQCFYQNGIELNNQNKVNNKNLNQNQVEVENMCFPQEQNSGQTLKKDFSFYLQHQYLSSKAYKSIDKIINENDNIDYLSNKYYNEIAQEDQLISKLEQQKAKELSQEIKDIIKNSVQDIMILLKKDYEIYSKKQKESQQQMDNFLLENKEHIQSFKVAEENNQKFNIEEEKQFYENGKPILIPDLDRQSDLEQLTKIVEQKKNNNNNNNDQPSQKKKILPKLPQQIKEVQQQKQNQLITKFEYSNNDVQGIIQSGDISRVLATDRGLLCFSETENLFYLKMLEKRLITPHLEGAYLNQLGDQLCELDKQQQSVQFPQFKHLCNYQVDKNEEIIYFTKGAHEVSSNQDIYIENTNYQYEYGLEIKASHDMRVLVGLLCMTQDKKDFNSARVFYRAQPAIFLNYDQVKGIINVKGDLKGWANYNVQKVQQTNNQSDQRCLGFYLNGKTELNQHQPLLPDEIIFWNGAQDCIDNPKESAYITAKNNQIQLSESGIQNFSNILPKLISGVSLIANHYMKEFSFLILLDIKKLQQSKNDFDYKKIKIKIQGEQRQENIQNYQNNQNIIFTSFWPQTKFVRPLLYTNWIKTEGYEREEQAKTSFKNIYFKKI